MENKSMGELIVILCKIMVLNTRLQLDDTDMHEHNRLLKELIK